MKSQLKRGQQSPGSRLAQESRPDHRPEREKSKRENSKVDPSSTWDQPESGARR